AENDESLFPYHAALVALGLVPSNLPLTDDDAYHRALANEARFRAYRVLSDEQRKQGHGQLAELGTGRFLALEDIYASRRQHFTSFEPVIDDSGVVIGYAPSQAAMVHSPTSPNATTSTSGKTRFPTHTRFVEATSSDKS